MSDATEVNGAVDKENGDGENAHGDRLSEPVGEEAPPRLAFPVVAVGASAGGLEAYTEFLQGSRADSGLAFVFIQHLSPKHESIMADILGRHTKMPVEQVVDGMEVKPNHVYVIRPGFTMTIREGRLHLGPSVAERGHRRPVDDFFRSLAEEQRERAICVVLSGTGSNGTAGAQAVKAVGGFCIAQEPESAKYTSMPRGLIDTGLADAILRPKEIFEAVVKFAAHPYVKGSEPPPELVASREKRALDEVVAVLRTRTRHDFSGYKKPTLVRRIQRRMSLLQTEKMSEYVKSLRQNPMEVKALSDDLMIHVTGFFRDAAAWDRLYETVIVPMVAEKANGGAIRCWVTACSTGEEAYTLAMLILEAAEAADKHFEIKVFATDTAERSLVQARSGIFPGGIESDMTPARLERFFEKDDSFYRVRKQLRELVVFAPQNVLQDPPFSRLDICTCRNLLIYIEPEVQRRVLSMLHFGLHEGGALLLGNSETVTGSEDLFEAIDKKLRIYRRVGLSRHAGLVFPLPAVARVSPGNGPEYREIGEQSDQPLPRAIIAHLATKNLVEKYTPAAVVVEKTGQVVYFHGSTTRYLMQPGGEPTRDILELAREEVRGTLRNTLQRAIASGEAAEGRDGTFGEGAERIRVEIHVQPLEERGSSQYFLVSFHERADPPPVLVKDGKESVVMAEELRRVRDELQSTIEELQTSNEEMKASHEEVTSVNEELQSTNEELETSKEELQSLNEELSTVNSQLQAKMEELERTGNDLSSLLSSTDIAVIFLDTKFRIRRFTPATRALVELIPADIGRPLSDLARKFDDAPLLADAQEVLERLRPVERETIGANGRWYMRRVLPYRTADNRIDGVVITFVDVTELRKSETAVRAGEERLRQLMLLMPTAVYRCDEQGKIEYYNERAPALWGREPSRQDLYWPEFKGWGAFSASGDVVNPKASPMAEALKTGQAITEREMVIEQGEGERMTVMVSVTPVFDEHRILRGAVAVFVDITERKHGEMVLKAAKESAESANRAKDSFLAMLSHELRTPLSSMMLWLSVLEKGKYDEETTEGMQSLERGAKALDGLINELLDSARIAAGKMRLDMQPTDLRVVMSEAVEAIEPTAKAKGLEVEREFAEDAPPVFADGSRVQQIVWNLLSNAVKFTAPGGKIGVRLMQEGGEMVIEVRDTGQGIDAAFLPHVFERFKQAELSAARQTGGLGLGLAIVKQLVDMHNGTVTAESGGSGKGSVFTVRLPVATPSMLKAASERMHLRDGAETVDLSGVKVLLVEDKIEALRAMGKLLAGAGASVEEAETVKEALERFARNRPDVLVSDIHLPDGDGYGLLKEIREMEKKNGTAPVSALAVTAFAQSQDRDRAMRATFTGFIAKPFNPRHLIKEVGVAAGR